eukprot:1791879-Alexandrium_andersonii.AAC.1
MYPPVTPPHAGFPGPSSMVAPATPLASPPIGFETMHAHGSAVLTAIPCPLALPTPDAAPQAAAAAAPADADLFGPLPR